MLILGKDMRVHYPYAGHDIYITLRHPTTEEHVEYLSNRTVYEDGQIKTNNAKSAVKLLDKIMVDVEGLGYIDEKGADQPLTKDVPGWQQKVPANIKSRLAMLFDEGSAQVVTEGKPT